MIFFKKKNEKKAMRRMNESALYCSGIILAFGLTIIKYTSSLSQRLTTENKSNCCIVTIL
jgi:hypothetical protein